MNGSYLAYVPIMKALADETRLTIIDLLSCDEMCACHLLEEFNLSQSTLSYHMKILTDSGIVNGVKEGAWTRYKINRDSYTDAIRFLESIARKKEECIYKKRVGSGNSCHKH